MTNKKGWHRHSKEHRDAYLKGQGDKALARRRFLGRGGKITSKEDAKHDIMNIHKSLSVLLKDYYLLYRFAIRQPGDFYIGSRVHIKDKKRIMQLVRMQIPAYEKLGYATTITDHNMSGKPLYSIPIYGTY